MAGCVRFNLEVVCKNLQYNESEMNFLQDHGIIPKKICDVNVKL